MVDRALQNLGKMKNSRRSANSKAQHLEGRTQTGTPELGMALFRWFIDIRQGLSGRVSIKMFRAKAVDRPQKTARVRSECWGTIVEIYVALDQEVDGGVPGEPKASK